MLLIAESEYFYLCLCFEQPTSEKSIKWRCMWTGDGQWFPCLVAAGLSRIGTARRTTATSDIMVRHIDFSDTKKVTGRQWEGDGGGGGGHSGEYSTLTLHHTVISTD